MMVAISATVVGRGMSFWRYTSGSEAEGWSSLRRAPSAAAPVSPAARSTPGHRPRVGGHLKDSAKEVARHLEPLALVEPPGRHP